MHNIMILFSITAYMRIPASMILLLKLLGSLVPDHTISVHPD